MEGKKEYHFIHEPHLTYSETIERMKSENCDFRVIYNQPQELKRLFNLNAKTAVLKLENNKLKIVSYYD
jgi:hypothetical protein